MKVNKIMLVLCVVLLFFIQPSFAQSKYFSQEYSWYEYHGGYAVAEKPNGNYVIFGGANGYATNNFWSLFALEINLMGDSLGFNEYPIPNFAGSFYEVVELESHYLIPGVAMEENRTTFYSHVTRINKEDLTLDYNHFIGDTLLVNGINDCIALSDSIFVGAGLTTLPGQDPAYWQLSFKKFNDEGEILWEHLYDGYVTSSNNFLEVIRPAEDGGFYLMGTKHWLLLSGDEVFMKVDSMGVREWELDLFPSDDIKAGGMDFIITSDGGFLFLLREDRGASEYLHIQKRRADLSLEWHIFPNYSPQDYFYRGPAKMLELPDGTVIMAGSHYVNMIPGHMNLQMMKIDADGNELWRRSYGGNGNDYAYDLIVLEDGSLVMSGRSAELGVFGSKVWLLKTNCMGLLTEPEAAFNYDAVDAFNVQFINQSQFVYPDSTDGGRYLWSFGDGTTSTEPHPQHTFPDAAEYEVTLTAIVCSDTSVYTQTVSTEPTGIKPQARGESITVLPPIPNPAASGLPIRIGFEFPHFIQNKTAVVHLYDINGRLLHEGQQTGGGVYELPTSRLTAGMYLYGVEWEGNVLRRGKVTLF